MRTFKHVFSLAIENTGARLQVLAAEEVCESNCDGIGGAWDDGLWLSLLVLMRVRMLVPMATTLGLLLLHCLHPRLLLLHGLSFEMLDELRDCHASLLSVDSELALHGSNLLGRGHPRHLPGVWLTLHGGTVERPDTLRWSRCN